MSISVVAARQAWHTRSPRERVLIGVMLALAGLVLATFLVIKPIYGWRDAAEGRRLAAEATLRQARTDAVRIKSASRGVGTGNAAPDLDALIRASSAQAGVTAMPMMAADGRPGFEVTGARPSVVLGWLGDLQSAGQARVCSLGVTENPDGTVNVIGSLSASAC